ncbi:MAG: T9SS type A sorting domain-containing protein [Bacteroidota bacterium]
MKKLLLFAILITCGVAVMAQFSPAKLSRSLQNKYVLETPAIDNQSPLMQTGNPVVNTKSVMDDNLGVSGTYDMQSNGAPMERVVCWPDGTVAAAWIKADLASYADRGTGYNYNNGTAWGAAPAARVEANKTGWPNLCAWNGNGEMILAHNSTSKLVISTRAVKGTGAWTRSDAPTGPIGSAGTALNILWPRAITSGSNHQYVHVICLTMPVANGGITYKGLDGALIYYRSLDGGANWDKQAVLLADLDSIHYNGFSGDDYTWIEPHGDTIAFLQGSVWNGTFLMKSFDNGSTWTKQEIVHNYYSKKTATQVITPTFGCDGTMAGAMDKNGVFHVAFGRMRNSQDASGSYFSPGTDGVVYWKSTEAALDTAMLANIDSVDAHHKLIGYVAANAAGDSIVGFPYYKGALCNFPSVNIDKYNNIYFMWRGLTVGNPDPTPYNYSHVWGRALFNGKSEMSPMVDFNADFLYIFQEFAYPAVSKTIKGNNKLLVVAQTAAQPGSNVVVGTSTYPPVPVHEVSFSYREINTSLFIAAGVPTSPVANRNFVGQNYPNPVKGTTAFMVNVDKAAAVTVEVSNIMGMKVMNMDKGLVNAGSQKFTIDCNSLPSGIYFYTVKINGESYTHKMIVE